MSELIDLPLEDIEYDEEFNCRGHIPIASIVEFAAELKRDPLLQPVLVIPKGDKYKLYVGHRRYLAFKYNGAKTIKAIINRDISLEDARFYNFNENLKRKDLDIVQEARAVENLFAAGIIQAEVARRLGQSVGWVSARLSLLELPIELQEAARAGVLTQYHVLRIAKMPHTEQQFAALRKIKDGIKRGKPASAIVVSPVKKLAKKKRVRKPQDLMHAIEFCFNTEGLGEGPHTYFLAWASGEITNMELMHQLYDHLKEQGIKFTIPPYAEIPDPNIIDERDFLARICQ